MRKRFKIPLLLLVTLFMVGTGAVIWLARGIWLEAQVSAWLNRTLAQTSGVRLTIGDFTGNLVSNLGARGIVVVRIDNPSDTVLVIPSLTAEYSLRDLWNRQWTVRQATLGSLRIYVPRDSIAAHFRSLVAGATRKDARSKSAFSFILESLVLSDAVVIRKGDPFPAFDSINIQLSAQANGGDIDVWVPKAVVHRPDFGHISLAGQFHRVGEIWSADSVVLRTPGSFVEASGSSHGWVLRAGPADLRELRPLIGQAVPATLDFTGTLHLPNESRGLNIAGDVNGTLGPFDFRDITADLTIRNNRLTFESVTGWVSGSYWDGSGSLDVSVKPARHEFAGNVRGFNLNRWVEGTFPSDLSGFAEITGSGLKTEELRLEIGADLRAGHFDNVVFDSAMGKITVTNTEVILGEEFHLNMRGTRIIGGGRIGYADSLDLFANVYSADLRYWDDRVFIDSLAGRAEGYVYLGGDTRDPDVAGRVFSDSVRLWGIHSSEFEAWFHAPRFMSQPTGTVDVRFGSASLWGWQTDSIQIRASLSDRIVRFDSLALNAPEVVLNARGQLDWTRDTIPIVLYPMTARWENQVFAAADPVVMNVDPEGFLFEDVDVVSEMGELQVTGRLNYDQTMDLQFAVEGVPIGPTRRRFLPSFDLDGQLACRGELRGSFAQPELDIDGEMYGLTYEGTPLGDLSGELGYRNQRLQSDDLRLTHRDYTVIASGMLPLSLRFDTPEAMVLDEPLAGRLSAAGEGLDLVAQFIPETVESIRGPFSVSAVLGGTPRAPHVTGNAYLRSGVVKTVDIVNPIEDLQVDLLLQQDTIVIARAEGKIRDKKRSGRLTAGGRVRILSYNELEYDVTLKGQKIPARFEYQDFYVETDLDLSVTGANPPLVAGAIAPQRVEDRAEFEDDELVEVADTTSWDWDMVVDIPGNYWIHNDQIDAELSAQLRLLRHRGHLTYLGSAEILRGKVFLFDKIGRISRGVLTFDNVNKPDPLLDIDVGFRIRQPRASQDLGSEASQELELELHVGGTASEPLIQAINTDYTEQDVLLLLTANSTFGSDDPTATSDPWADRLKFAATGLFFSEVQRVAARKLGLETLEISSGGNTASTEISVGRYFSPHLYLYGSSPIDVGSGQEVGFEYRFNRRLYLEGNRDKDNLYRLNIHFNWDY